MPEDEYKSEKRFCLLGLDGLRTCKSISKQNRLAGRRVSSTTERVLVHKVSIARSPAMESLQISYASESKHANVLLRGARG